MPIVPNYVGFAEIYDLASHDIAETTWRNGILKTLQAYGITGTSVLDLGCGTGMGGRLIQELKPALIVGLDRSPSMLRAAVPYYTGLLLQDFREFTGSDDRFDFIVAGFDTLNYLDHRSFAAVLSTCAKTLKGCSSRLIFDYSSPELLQNHWRDLNYEQELDETRRLEWSHKCDVTEGRTVTRVTLVKEEREAWTEIHLQYTMAARQLRDIALGSGLTVETVRDLLDSSYSESSHTHLYSLRKARQNQAV